MPEEQEPSAGETEEANAPKTRAIPTVGPLDVAIRLLPRMTTDELETLVQLIQERLRQEEASS
jgi:hypothetical protein